MNEYNITRYVIPENTVLQFSPTTARSRIVIKQLSGSLLYNTGERFPQEEYELPLMQQFYPGLRSNTACDFILRGYYSFFRAMQTMPENERMLFQVFHLKDSCCSFLMGENTQLQIFVIEDDDSDVFIKCSGGSCQIFGQIISEENKWRLLPCSTFVVSSIDNAEYSVHVWGSKRRIKVSLTENRILGCVRSVRHDIQNECSLAKTIGPTFLVVGPTNTGKTSFCHWMLNGAIDDGMIPVYINLDIRRCIPGTISLRKVDGRSDVAVGYVHYSESLLHFGNVVFDSNTIQLYYLLVRKMGEISTSHQTSTDASLYPTIIDMCGMLGEDIPTIKCVLESFTVNQILYIGNDRNDYENLKKALPSTVKTDFIPAPEDIEPKSESWDANYVRFKIREYFYGGMRRPVTPNQFVVKIENLRVYRVMTEINDFELINARSDDFLVERISCGPNLENYLLAFMGDGDLNEHNLAEKKMEYYVCIETVDLKTNTVTVLGPGQRSFSSGVLLMSDLQLRN